LKIIQITPVLSYGDGVGNDIAAMDRVLKQNGYDTQIFSLGADKRVEHLMKDINDMPDPKKDDIVIYHMATGSMLTDLFKKLKCYKIMVYHNVTPPYFFKEYNKGALAACEEGLNQVRDMKNYVDYCMTPSEYNKQNLIDFGYTCPIEVLPIIIPFGDYEKEADKKIIEQYSDGITNIVFTGRIVPNKKQEDIIEAFYYYNKYWNADSRLILVGNYNGMENYYIRLQRYVKELMCENVIFTGHINFSQILAYYKAADVFLCLSEHEGFCIPLLEAMYFKKPIVAFDAAAVGETMADSGIKLKNKNGMEIAGIINKLMSDKNLYDKIIAAQTERLRFFNTEKVENQFVARIDKIAGKNSSGKVNGADQ